MVMDIPSRTVVSPQAIARVTGNSMWAIASCTGSAGVKGGCPSQTVQLFTKLVWGGVGTCNGNGKDECMARLSYYIY